MSASALSTAAFISGVISALLLSSSAQPTPPSASPSTVTPGLKAAVLAGLEDIVGRDIDALQHRGQHLARMQPVLVGIDADAELAGIRRRLQHADAGAAGRVIDDVGAAIELRLGELAALHRIVPGGARGAGHVLEDFAHRSWPP